MLFGIYWLLVLINHVFSNLCVLYDNCYNVYNIWRHWLLGGKIVFLVSRNYLSLPKKK